MCKFFHFLREGIYVTHEQRTHSENILNVMPNLAIIATHFAHAFKLVMKNVTTRDGIGTICCHDVPRLRHSQQNFNDVSMRRSR